MSSAGVTLEGSLWVQKAFLFLDTLNWWGRFFLIRLVGEKGRFCRTHLLPEHQRSLGIFVLSSLPPASASTTIGIIESRGQDTDNNVRKCWRRASRPVYCDNNVIFSCHIVVLFPTYDPLAWFFEVTQKVGTGHSLFLIRLIIKVLSIKCKRNHKGSTAYLGFPAILVERRGKSRRGDYCLAWGHLREGVSCLISLRIQSPPYPRRNWTGGEQGLSSCNFS